jgi:hypothetical protein
VEANNKVAENPLQRSPNVSTTLETRISSLSPFLGVLRKVFSFPVAIAFLLVVLAVLTVQGRFDDPDMWWHLKMGQVIWTTHSIPLHDIFSFTTGHHASVPQEWLSQVTIYLAYKFAGYPGMMLWLCLFTAALFVAGYILCSLYSANVKVAFVGSGLIWFFATVGLAIRPQLIGYLLLVIELILVYLGRYRNPRWFFALPVLFLLWVNCHGSFFLGLIVAGVYLFSSFFHFHAGSFIAPRWDPQTRRMLAIAFLLSCAVLFLNPDSIHQVLYPLDTLLHQSLQMKTVQEWQPTQMSSPRGIGLLVILLSCFLIVVVGRSLLYWDELLILIAATWLGVSHSRTLFAFGILVAPIFSRMIAGFWENYSPGKDHHWFNAILMLVALAAAVLAFPGEQSLQKDVVANSPVRAVEYIQRHHLQGPMLNDYGYGGYLIWAAPQYPDFVDGRGDVFEWSGVLREYGAWAMLEANPNLLLNKYNINFCLLTAQSPMAHVLPLLPNWKEVYSDNDSAIFVRKPSDSSLALSILPRSKHLSQER